MKHFEPDVNARIDAAEESAQKVVDGEFADVDEYMMALRAIIADKRHMGFFDDYFKKRTLDELVFEATLVTAKPRDNVDYGSKLLKKDEKATAAITDDWDFSAIDKAQAPAAPAAPDQAAPVAVEETQFWKDAVDFMKSGEFKQEGTKK